LIERHPFHFVGRDEQEVVTVGVRFRYVHVQG
jgi:hypothetical protein